MPGRSGLLPQLHGEVSGASARQEEEVVVVVLFAITVVIGRELPGTQQLTRK